MQSPVYPDGAQDTVALSSDLRIVNLQEGVFQIIHAFPWAANSLLVRVSDDSVVWVDTPYEDGATEQVLGWVREALGDVEILEINTGYHWDNAGGNGALLRNGIPVWGADLSAALLRDRGEWIRSETLRSLGAAEHARYRAVHADQIFHAPDHRFPIEEGFQFEIGDEVIEAFYPGPSHAPDNLVVYFRNRRILFGGCMIRALESRSTGYTGDADLENWPPAVEAVIERYPEAELVIPGHGSAGGPELLTHTLMVVGF